MRRRSGQRVIVLVVIGNFFLSSTAFTQTTKSILEDTDPNGGDGLNWVKLGLNPDVGPPGLLDDNRVTPPSVILDNHVCKMW